MHYGEPPRLGEAILGCCCRVACGPVSEVVRRVTGQGLDHYLVREGREDRIVRVRREPNDWLYEVELV